MLGAHFLSPDPLAPTPLNESMADTRVYGWNVRTVSMDELCRKSQAAAPEQRRKPYVRTYGILALHAACRRYTVSAICTYGFLALERGIQRSSRCKVKKHLRVFQQTRSLKPLKFALSVSSNLPWTLWYHFYACAFCYLVLTRQNRKIALLKSLWNVTYGFLPLHGRTSQLSFLSLWSAVHFSNCLN